MPDRGRMLSGNGTTAVLMLRALSNSQEMRRLLMSHRAAGTPRPGRASHVRRGSIVRPPITYDGKTAIAARIAACFLSTRSLRRVVLRLPRRIARQTVVADGKRLTISTSRSSLDKRVWNKRVEVLWPNRPCSAQTCCSTRVPLHRPGARQFEHVFRRVWAGRLFGRTIIAAYGHGT